MNGELDAGAEVRTGTIAGLFVGVVREEAAAGVAEAAPIVGRFDATLDRNQDGAGTVTDAAADGEGETGLVLHGRGFIVAAVGDGAVQIGAAGLDVAERAAGLEADDQPVIQVHAFAGADGDDDAGQLLVERIVDRVPVALAGGAADVGGEIGTGKVMGLRLGAGGGADEGNGRQCGAGNAFQQGHVFFPYSV